MRGHDFSLTWFYGNLSGLCVMEGRETGQGTAGQGGDDVRVADGESQVGVRFRPDRFHRDLCQP